jgi:hypothetical protein
MRIAGAKAESICSIPPGKLVGTIRSGSYVPQHMAFALDHTIWTIGFEMGYESRAEDFNVIHHYTRSGKKWVRRFPGRKLPAITTRTHRCNYVLEASSF